MKLEFHPGPIFDSPVQLYSQNYIAYELWLSAEKIVSDQIICSIGAWDFSERPNFLFFSV